MSNGNGTMGQFVEVGDYVRHPDDKKLYRVESLSDGAVYLDDGGVIGREEIHEVLLESEGYDEFYRQVR